MKKVVGVVSILAALLAALLTAAPAQADPPVVDVAWVESGRLNVCVGLRPEASSDPRWDDLRLHFVDWASAGDEDEAYLPSDAATVVKTVDSICQDVFVEPGYRFYAGVLPVLADGYPASIGNSAEEIGWVDLTAPPSDSPAEIWIEAVRTQLRAGAAGVDIGWSNAPSPSEILVYGPELGEWSRPDLRQPVVGSSGAESMGTYDCGEHVEFVLAPPSGYPLPLRVDLDPYATTGPVDVICSLNVSLAKLPRLARLRAEVDVSRGNDDWPIHIQKRQSDGSYRTVKTVLTEENWDQSPEFATVTVRPGRYRAVVPTQLGYARGVSGSVLVPALRAKVQPVNNRTRLKVDVDPSLGAAAWTVNIQKKRPNGKFRTIKTVKTVGTAETKVIDVRRGRYRAVVPAQRGYQPVVSGTVFIRR